MFRNKLIHVSLCLTIAGLLGMGMLTGCTRQGDGNSPDQEAEAFSQTEAKSQSEIPLVEIEQTGQDMPMGLSEELQEQAYVLPDSIRIGAVRGCSAVGLAYLAENLDLADTKLKYEFIFNNEESVITELLKNGEVDIAFLSPLNAVATSYQMDSRIQAIGVSALSDLYVVTADSEISLISDLIGRTVYISGRGTAVDCAIQNIFEVYGANIEMTYLESAEEVEAAIQADMNSAGILDVEHAVKLVKSNDAFNTTLSLAECWNHTPSSMGSEMLNTVIMADFSLIEAYPDAIDVFLNEYENALLKYEDNSEQQSAELLLRRDLADDCGYLADILSYCFPVCMKNSQMLVALSGYYQVIFQQDSSLFGDREPDASFYYTNSATEAPSVP